MLVSRPKIYVAFLNNYQKALEALHRCTEAYPPFADLTRSIKLRSVKGQRQGQSLSLEDLLHKPVGRIQKHCLCLQVRTVMKFQAYFLKYYIIMMIEIYVNSTLIPHTNHLKMLYKPRRGAARAPP